MSRRTRACGAGVASLLAAAAHAQSVSWVTEGGDWHDPANWDSGAIPSPDEQVTAINNGGIVFLEADAAVSSLGVGFDGVAAGVNGFADAGVLGHDDGRLSVGVFGGAFQIGLGSGVSGAYLIRGPAFLDGLETNVGVGNGGEGEFFARHGALARVLSIRCSDAWGDDEPGPIAQSRSELTIADPGTLVRAVQFDMFSASSVGVQAGAWGTSDVHVRDGARLEAEEAGFFTSTPKGSIYSVTGGAEVRLARLNGASSLRVGRSPLVEDDATVGPALLRVKDGARVAVDGDVELLPQAIVRGDGRIEGGRFEVSEDVRFEPMTSDEGAGTLTLDGVVDVTGAAPDRFGAASVAVRLFPDGVSDALALQGVIGLQGRLEVTPVPFNEPELGDRFTIVTLADQRGLVGDDLADLGAFTELDLPDLGPDAIIRPVYSLDRIELVVACPADLDVNGVLDLDDVAAFVDRFLGDDPVADLTLDGAINLDDVARFVASYLAGCG